MPASAQRSLPTPMFATAGPARSASGPDVIAQPVTKPWPVRARLAEGFTVDDVTRRRGHPHRDKARGLCATHYQ
ncbi:MAG: hypothetical protein WCF04_03280 [Candidatus Nanopelagicales bacterium]